VPRRVTRASTSARAATTAMSSARSDSASRRRAYDALVRSNVLSPCQALREAGLALREQRRERLIDTFRERIIFPIFDPGNRVIALGGRVLPEELREMPGEPGPKYRNSPESASTRSGPRSTGSTGPRPRSPGIKRRSSARATPTSSASHRPESARAVATCGTALTEDHFRLLSRFARPSRALLRRRRRR
jgi:DNA primase